MNIKEFITVLMNEFCYSYTIQLEIIKELLSHGKLGGLELAKKLGRPLSTLYKYLDILEEKHIIERFKKKTKGKQGRPFTLFRIPKNLMTEISNIFEKEEKKWGMGESRKIPDFIKNRDSDKKIFLKYRREASERYTQKMRLQKTIDDKIRPQTLIVDYFIKN